ncbi:MAG TPA: Omp28-related outer membrane protein [Candidatus Kapabacteria bacterium]
MILSTTFKRMAFVILALSSLLFAASDSSAQYTRHAVFEEVTGTWCQYCPPGAWYSDSTEHKYGDNFVAIAWHGPVAYAEPFATEAGDTLVASFQIGGYPTALLNRAYSGGFSQGASMGIGVYTQAAQVPKEMNKPAVVDFRIVNLTYNAGTKDVEFDVDITPLDITKMMKEDTAEYATVAVLTEDDLASDQTHFSAGQLEGFIHHNVVRKVGGKVMGDKFTLGTLLASPTLPVRRHYRMKIEGDWNPDKIKAKAFVMGSYIDEKKNVKYTEIYDAGQSPYVGAFGPEAVDAVWVVLPKAGYTIKKATPTNIIWSKSGATTSVKIEYTVDGGATWTTVIASTNQSPYAWTLPEADYGKTAQIRITDVSNAAIKALSAEFPTPGVIAVTKPALNDSVKAGEATLITWTKANTSGRFEFHYSTNGGIKWNYIGVLNNADATAYSGWIVPDIATTPAVVRVRDGNDTTIFSVSSSFIIHKEVVTPKPGKFLSLTMAGVVNNKIGSSEPTTFSWTKENEVGATKTIQISTDNGASWGPATTATGDVSFTDYTTPAGHIPAALFRIYSALDQSDMYTMTTPIEIGSNISVKNIGGAPTAFTMSANYPNPFASTTNINFEVPERNFVTIIVRNELGVEVARLVNENLDAGKYSVDLSAANLSNGLYTYILESGSTKLVGKMTIVK